MYLYQYVITNDIGVYPNGNISAPPQNNIKWLIQSFPSQFNGHITRNNFVTISGNEHISWADLFYEIYSKPRIDQLTPHGYAHVQLYMQSVLTGFAFAFALKCVPREFL